ncbi:hypothetical protein MOUN0_O00716 [Monosporozyma unispora]|nr:hypothetical protein C6P44_001918 [Kazachstania unispora]
MSFESLDLFLNLLNQYKPHLKPYKNRIKTWERILIEYNLKVGTTYKQYRTLKSKFEKIIDLYQRDKNLVECDDPKLLDILINEYNKPYRLTQRDVETGTLIPLNSRSTSIQLESSKSSRSSTSPYITPLDTIALGMPRKDERRENVEEKGNETREDIDVILPPIQYPTSQRIRNLKSLKVRKEPVISVSSTQNNSEDKLSIETLSKLLGHLADKSHWLREDLSEFANNNLNNQSALISSLEQMQAGMNHRLDQLQGETSLLQNELAKLKQRNIEFQAGVLAHLAHITERLDQIHS